MNVGSSWVKSFLRSGVDKSREDRTPLFAFTAGGPTLTHTHRHQQTHTARIPVRANSEHGTLQSQPHSLGVEPQSDGRGSLPATAAVGDEVERDVLVAAVSGDVDRRPAVPVRETGVGAELDKQFHKFQVPVHDALV